MQGPSRVPTQWATNAPVPVGWMRQFRYMASLFEGLKDVEGDVVECGLGEGNTFAMLAYLVGSESGRQAPRVLWGFDSFEGWPEPTAHDQSPRSPQRGEWKVDRAMIEERLEQSRIREEFPNLDITVVWGFLEQTLPNFPDRPIALLHLDVDLYPGYHAGLTWLFPKVVRGGVVLLDEYKEYPNLPEYNFGKIEKWPGATKAVDEYFDLSHNPCELRYHNETKKFYVIVE